MQDIKKEVYEVLNTLNSNNYEAYLVGGATRNLLLGLEIDDFDVTTSATPNAIKLLFNKYNQYTIGEKHGTVVVIINNVKIDITTFRKDFDYKDYRHPNKIIFSSNLYDDVRRRDFTINAICLDAKNNLIDYFDGIKDIEKKTIKAIGDPNTRFREDALRILRAIRFSAKLDFKIEKYTKEAIFNNYKLLKHIAVERKKEELLKILSYHNSYKILNTYKEIFNEFIKYNKVDKKVDAFSDPYFCLAYIIKDSINNLKDLKFSNKEICLINYLINASNIDINDNYSFICAISNEYKEIIIRYLCEMYGIHIKDKYKTLKKYCIEENDLKIDGTTLMKLGYKGKEIKCIKQEIIDLIHHQSIENTKLSILKYLKR